MPNVFLIGKFTKPQIKHDHGFLDDGKGNIDPSKKRKPTADDFIAYAKWIAKLEVAEEIRWDLKDALAAYRHFLFGNGKSRKFNYDKFIKDDPSGKKVLELLLKEVRYSAMRHIADTVKLAASDQQRLQEFELYCKIIGVGGKQNLMFPYPETENWQKAIGAHFIYGKAMSKVTIPPKSTNASFVITINMFAEDMYNFNPKNKDIKTGIPDEDNGKFETCGLAKEYLNHAEFKRTYSFEATLDEIRSPMFAQVTNETVAGGGR